MTDVFFIRFPKPGKDLEKCVRWVKACSRKGFDETRVKKDTYICSKHFVGGAGPTDLHPDLIPANATKFDVQRFQKKPRRKVQRCLNLNGSSSTGTKQSTVISSASSDPIQHQNSSEHEVADILLSLGEKTMLPKENVLPVEAEDCKASNQMEMSSCVFYARKLCDKETQTYAGTSMDISLRIKNRILENVAEGECVAG